MVTAARLYYLPKKHFDRMSKLSTPWRKLQEIDTHKDLCKNLLLKRVQIDVDLKKGKNINNVGQRTN